MPRIIAISGIDGSGKSTLGNSLCEYLNRNGEPTVFCDAMKNGRRINSLLNKANRLDDDIRNIVSPNTLNLFWTLDLIDKFNECYEKYYKNNVSIIYHRSFLCCEVYSELFGSNINIIKNIINNSNVKYDMQIHMMVSPCKAYGRIISRNKTNSTNPKEQLTMLERATILYDYYINNEIPSNVIIFNNGSSFESEFAKLCMLHFKFDEE